MLTPVIRSAGKALKFKTPKAVGHTISEKAIQNPINVAIDAIMGNDSKEGNEEK